MNTQENNVTIMTENLNLCCCFKDRSTLKFEARKAWDFGKLEEVKFTYINVFV